MKKTVLLASVFVLLMSSAAFATNGYQLIGVGAVQASMGGASTAAPLTAMTAITNPAGMARIGSRADFSMEMLMPVRKVDFSKNMGEKTKGGTPMYGIPALGWTAPAFRDGMYFGGGMYATSGMGVDYGEVNMTPGHPFYGSVEFTGHSAIQFMRMSPTVAWNSGNTSFGVALNMDYQSVSITQKIVAQNNATGPATPGGTLLNVDLGRPTAQYGYGLTFGVLHDLGDQLTIGASYSSKQTFDAAEFRVAAGDVKYGALTGQAGTYKLDLQYPQTMALGVSWHPDEKLMVAADAKWINWSSTHDKVRLTGPNGAHQDFEFGWEDQYVLAVGTQYVLNEKVKLRAGFNYAKAPIDEKDVFNNLLLPALTEKHLTFGGDYQFNDHWTLSATFVKAFKKELVGKGDVPAGPFSAAPAAGGFSPDSGTKISLEGTSVMTQLSYLF